MNIRRHSLLLAGLALFTVAVHGQSPAVRDVWYEFMDGDVRYGFRHVEVVKLEDGNFRYSIDSKVLIDLFGAQKQETVTHSEYVVTPDLRPVSIATETTSLAGKTRVQGTARDGKLVMQIHRLGADRELEIPIEDSDPPLFSVCVIDHLAMLPAATKTTTIREIEEGGWSIETFTASRIATTADSAAWKVKTGAGIADRTLTFGADGIFEQLVSETPSLLMRRSTKERATKITYLHMTGKELLTFPLDKPIPSPDRLRRLAVRLRWTDIPLDELDLVDARQSIASQAIDNGNHNVVIEITEPAPLDDADELTLPVDDETFAPYLAETYYIKPQHPKIIAAARNAIQDEKKALAAVKALCKFVEEHVTGELMAATLSGPEVLAMRRGKCSEYSSLFASLARSVGIPTRMVLGERLAAGQWMGHMWNEAYVGRWVTVDASVGEIDRSFALLKFVDSDTLDGTQPARWKLTKSLSITVESFDTVPSDLDAKYVAGIRDQTYTSIDHRCRIEAVGDGWTLEDKSTPQAATIRFGRKDAKNVHIHLVPFAVPEGTKPATILDARIGTFRGHYQGLEVLANEARTVAGVDGHTTRMRGKRKKTSKAATVTTEVLWVRGGHGYLLNIIAPASEHDAQLKHFETLLKGFQFLD